MAINEAVKVTLSERQDMILQQLQDGTHTRLHLKIRAKIVRLANQGNTNNSIESAMGIHGETVTQWRNRFAAAEKELSTIEADDPRKLRAAIIRALSDEPRSGKPPKINDEQVACIIALSCENPMEIGLPFSNWTLSSLRDEVIRKGIVGSVSKQQIWRFLKRRRT
jgi:transposase